MTNPDTSGFGRYPISDIRRLATRIIIVNDARAFCKLVSACRPKIGHAAIARLRINDFDDELVVEDQGSRTPVATVMRQKRERFRAKKRSKTRRVKL